MLEHEHFPHLSRLAFNGLIDSHIDKLSIFLRGRPEAQKLTNRVCKNLSKAFINDLFGTDYLGALLGLAVLKPAERNSRARRASLRLTAQLPRP